MLEIIVTVWVFGMLPTILFTLHQLEGEEFFKRFTKLTMLVFIFTIALIWPICVLHNIYLELSVYW